MDKRPKSPQSNQVHQIVEKGAQLKKYISDIVSNRLLTMQGRPPAQFHSTYKNPDETKHAVDLTEKSCTRILIACGMTIVMLVIGVSLVGGILLAVTELDEDEEPVTVPALSGYLICPRDIVTRAEPGERHAVVSWELPVFQTVGNDVNATALIFESNYESNTSFEIGVGVVIYTVTDDENIEETCSFRVIVKDKEKPIFETCPQNIEVVTDEFDGKYLNPTWDKPKATDNAGTTPRINTNYHGETFEIGTRVMRYTATDSAGNYARCVFQVTIIDGTPPVILDCPEDVKVTTGHPQWAVPTAVDNGQLVSFESDWAPGATFPLGRTRVTYVAMDSASLKTECSFDVVMFDLEAPVFINCLQNITVTTDENGSYTPPTWQTPRATDNTGPPQVTTSHSGKPFKLGRTTKITYMAIDDSGNGATCSFFVTLKDGTPPTIEGCPSDIAQPNDHGTPTGQAYWTPPVAMDNGNVVDFDSNRYPGDIFSLGATRVVYTAVDSEGLRTECSFVVTITDREAPIFTYCPPDIEKGTDQDGNFDLPTWPTPRAVDNAGVPRVTTTHMLREFKLGEKTPIRYTATDGSGNNATCQFYVTIVDETPPVIRDCPHDITITTDPRSPTGKSNWSTPSATDNGKHVTLTSSANSGDAFHIGKTRVTYTAVDGVGLTAKCQFTVTVSDNEDPVFIRCPSNYFLTTDASGKYNYPFWQTPEAVDNSGDPPEVSTTHRFKFFELNSNTSIKYQATDAAGNNAICVFHISVTDGTPPELIDCPDDITVSADPNSSTSRVDWSHPTVSDNSKEVDLTSNWKSSDQFPLGNTQVTFTAVDPSGLTSECHFTVTVMDTEEPVFTTCPSDFDRVTDADGNYDHPVWETPRAVDNGGQLQVTTTFEFTPFELGAKTPIEYIATDADNNKATCVFYVTILDGTPPVITRCPSAITVSTDPHRPTRQINWTVPTAEDNGGYVHLTSNWSPGDSFPLGRTRVVYTALDGVGLRDRCRFTVTVEDNEAPVFDSCPRDIVKLTDASGKFDYPTWPYPHAIDNSGHSPDITTTSRFQMFPIDEATFIEYFATDGAGNTATCRFYVTIKDTTPPDIKDCPGDITVSIDPRSATGRAVWIPPIASDNAYLVSFNTNWDPGDTFPLGETNVTYVAMDSAGLTSECQFTVTIEARCNLSLSTPALRNSYQYRFPFPSSKQSDDESIFRFDFAIRSAGTVYIALAEDQTSSEVYEIGLGGSKSFIRCGILCKPRYITVRTPDLITASEYHRLWITYDKNGLIRVGRSNEEPFMEWQDPSTPLDIQRIGIASYHEADWKGYLCKIESQVIGWL